MARGIEPKPSNSDDDHLFNAQLFSFGEEQERKLQAEFAWLDQQPQPSEYENDEAHALLIANEHRTYDYIEILHPEVARLHKILYFEQTHRADYDTMRLEEDLVDAVEYLESAGIPAAQLDQAQRMLDIAVSMRLLADATSFEELSDKQNVQRNIYLLPGLYESDKSVFLAAADLLLTGEALDMQDVDVAASLFYAENEAKQRLYRERAALRAFHNWSLQCIPHIDTRSDSYRIVAHYLYEHVGNDTGIALTEPIEALDTLGLDRETFHQLLRAFNGDPEPRAPMV